MTLEDHLGDIIRKARVAANVSAGTAAQAAGLSAAEFASMEEGGRFSTRPNFVALAGLLGLHADKLASIANGWLPAEIASTRWRELRCITTTQAGMAVNCYLIWDEVTREAALFDTGWDAAPIFDLIDENRIQLQHFFLTHSHEDHLAALGDLRARFPKLRLHSGSKHAPVDQRNRANEFVHLGGLRIANRDTPGHAEDGVTYVVGAWPEDAPQVAVVGDAIFAGSMGRGNQSWNLAKQKVRDQILSLPGETLICPGHGPLTTVSEENANNPFF